MLGTVTALAVVITTAVLQRTGYIETIFIPKPFLPLTVGALLLLVVGLLNAMILTPLQQAKEALTPRLGELYYQDRRLRFANGFCLLFIFLSFAFSATLYLDKGILFAIWLILLGMVLDTLYYSFRRMTAYLNSDFVIGRLVKQGHKSIQSGKYVEVSSALDGLTEIAIKSLRSNNISLCEETIKEIEELASYHVNQCKKRFPQHSLDASTKNEEAEQAYFILGYFLERLELIHTQAIEERVEPVSSQLIVSMGKIAIFVSRWNPAMSSLPLHYLGKFTHQAESQNLEEATLKASLTLEEIAKSALEDPEIIHLGMKDTLFNIIKHLEQIAKWIFQQDKTTNLSFLTQPFQDIKLALTHERFAGNPDAEQVVKELDRVLGEFAALELVLRTIPNIPGFSEEEGKNQANS